VLYQVKMLVQFYEIVLIFVVYVLDACAFPDLT